MSDAMSKESESAGPQDAQGVSTPQPDFTIRPVPSSEREENERLMRHFAAADELSWGGRGEVSPCAKGQHNLPDSWVDVTGIVSAQLKAVRERQDPAQPAG